MYSSSDVYTAVVTHVQQQQQQQQWLILCNLAQCPAVQDDDHINSLIPDSHHLLRGEISVVRHCSQFYYFQANSPYRDYEDDLVYDEAG